MLGYEVILNKLKQVYKGCCKNSGRHLAVKVVLDLTQKVILCTWTTAMLKQEIADE